MGEILGILLLIMVNGVLVMAEIAVVSARLPGVTIGEGARHVPGAPP